MTWSGGDRLQSQVGTGDTVRWGQVTQSGEDRLQSQVGTGDTVRWGQVT